MTRPEHGTHMTIAMDNAGHSLQAGMYCNCKNFHYIKPTINEI